MLQRIQENNTAGHAGPQLTDSAVPQSGLCAHCGSPVKSTSGTEAKFCCRGCEFVYNTLKGLGFGAYYNILSSSQSPFPRQDSSEEKRYTFLDSEDSEKNYIQRISQDTERISLYLSGIHCAACIWLLEKLPLALKGVKRARVQFARGEIEIDFDRSQVKPSEIAYMLNSLGYPPVPLTNLAIQKENQKRERQMMLRIGVAALCAANTMMLSVSLFQGFYSGIEEPYASIFRWLSAIIAFPAVTYCAWPFYRTAVAALMTATLHIDLPIAAAVIITYVSGIITTLNGQEYVYFDSVTTLIFLLLVGRFIQSRAVSRARATALSTWDLLPASVRVINSNSVTEKALIDLAINDRVEVMPGDRIPSDGTVIVGQSTLDNSFLTGESLPQAVMPGSEVLGGSINLESRLEIRATRIGRESRIGRILDEIDKNQSARTKSQDRANRLSSHFVFGVFGLSLMAYLIWNRLDPSRAFDIVVSILIVTCPCALGLAIPSAVSIALGRAKRRGIFIRKADALETLVDCENFYLDKTGTLTLGQISVLETFPSSHDLQSTMIAGSLAEAAPLHPVSQSILRYCRAENSAASAPDIINLRDIRHVPGRGVQAVLPDNRAVYLGSLKWLNEGGVKLNAAQDEVIMNWSNNGYSVSALAVADKIVMLFALADLITPEAEKLVSYLQSSGKNIFIISGDSQGAVSSVARTLGIPQQNALGELSPEQKSEIISSDKKQGCMLGDGLNDAPAMKQSDISVGLRGGIEATIEVASVYISSGKLSDFLQLLKAADKTSRVIRNNLCYAAGYNIIGGTLAMMGYINPLVAAFLMPLSSITIVSYSLLSRTFNER